MVMMAEYVNKAVEARAKKLQEDVLGRLKIAELPVGLEVDWTLAARRVMLRSQAIEDVVAEIKAKMKP